MRQKGLGSEERRQLCRELRQRQTPAEQFFWELVRTRRFEGLKFRRQQPAGQFVIDFYCPELKLAVELEGEVHEKREQDLRDTDREEYLRLQGLKVVRFSNDEVLNDPEGELDRLRESRTPYTGQGWPAVKPPSTGMVWPVMKSPAGLHNSTARPANSSTVPKRC